MMRWDTMQREDEILHGLSQLHHAIPFAKKYRLDGTSRADIVGGY